MLEELSELYSREERDVIFNDLLCKLFAVMSDRASVKKEHLVKKNQQCYLNKHLNTFIVQRSGFFVLMDHNVIVKPVYLRIFIIPFMM